MKINKIKVTAYLVAILILVARIGVYATAYVVLKYATMFLITFVFTAIVLYPIGRIWALKKLGPCDGPRLFTPSAYVAICIHSFRQIIL